jgi:hypothetical protein
MQSMKNKENKKRTQQQEIDNLKNEMSEIKSLLVEILNETRRN